MCSLLLFRISRTAMDLIQKGLSMVRGGQNNNTDEKQFLRICHREGVHDFLEALSQFTTMEEVRLTVLVSRMCSS